VNRIGKPVNEGDLKRITSDFNVFVDIFSKGESVGRTYFCVRGREINTIRYYLVQIHDTFSGDPASPARSRIKDPWKKKGDSLK
jgi:hypothetical protein